MAADPTMAGMAADQGDAADAAQPPKAAAGTPPPSSSVCGAAAAGEKRWLSLSLPPDVQRRMRFYLSCAIVDLKFNIWDHIQTHFVLEPSRHDLEENLDPAGGDSSHAKEVDDNCGNAEEDTEDDDEEEEEDAEEDTEEEEDAEEDTEDEEEEEEEEEEEYYRELSREFNEMYIIASGYDERMKEVDAIEEVYFDTAMDEETRTDMIDRLWRHIDKELSDRARAVSTGKFKF